MHFLILLILEKEREKSICHSTYLYTHWSILVCALTRDWTGNLGISGWGSNQLRYLARALACIFNSSFLSPILPSLLIIFFYFLLDQTLLLRGLVEGLKDWENNEIQNLQLDWDLAKL